MVDHTSLDAFTRICSIFITRWYFNHSRPDPGRREKINLNFIFTLCCLKGFYEGFKGLIKPFEALQTNVKRKI